MSYTRNCPLNVSVDSLISFHNSHHILVRTLTYKVRSKQMYLLSPINNSKPVNYA